ncbi:PH domain-containing protein [Corynebacterium sp. LK2510]|uniref:PH domain-containing protein n=1 Tax=Corynebacterium sp. LK2510 TaxID=3110472 RepID=UPI0034CE4147
MVSQLRRVHRLSPLLRVWTTLLAIVAVSAFNFAEPLFELAEKGNLDAPSALVALGALAASLLVVFAVSQLWWARTGFRLDEEQIELHRGLLTTKVRTARYDRIQAVDVVEPFAARLFGLAAVRLEAAGGTESGIEIAYLPRAEAEQVRAEILHSVDHDECDDHDLVTPIPTARSLAATALRLSAVFALAWASLPLWTGLGAATVLPVLIGLIPDMWKATDQSWRFTARLDTAGRPSVNLAYGLANRRRQTVPLERIHAVQLAQPVLWRVFGWWTVSVAVAGYGREGNAVTGTSKLLPVGTFDQALEVLAVVTPFTPDEIEHFRPELTSPRRARWVSPVAWKRQSVTVTRGMVVVTNGRVSRRVGMAKVPHVQELTYKQGVLQRRLGLAHVRCDLVPGPVRVIARDLDAGRAWGLVEKLRARELPELELTDGSGGITRGG